MSRMRGEVEVLREELRKAKAGEISPKSNPSGVEPSMLAHMQLPVSRRKETWKGGPDVKRFLKEFENLVEKMPGVTPIMAW